MNTSVDKSSKKRKSTDDQNKTPAKAAKLDVSVKSIKVKKPVKAAKKKIKQKNGVGPKLQKFRGFQSLYTKKEKRKLGIGVKSNDKKKKNKKSPKNKRICLLEKMQKRVETEGKAAVIKHIYGKINEFASKPELTKRNKKNFRDYESILNTISGNTVFPRANQVSKKQNKAKKAPVAKQAKEDKKHKTVQKAQEKKVNEHKQNKKNEELAIKVEVKDENDAETLFKDLPAVKIEKDSEDEAIKIEVKEEDDEETSFIDLSAVKIEKDSDKNKELAIKIEVNDEETSFKDLPAVKIEKDSDKNKELAIKIEVNDEETSFKDLPAVKIEKDSHEEDEEEENKVTKPQKKRKNKKPRYVLFIGNIPYDTTKDELWEHFKRLGDIADVRIPPDKESNRCRGFAYLELSNEAAYQKALDLNGSQLKNRKIKVEYTQGGNKKREDQKKHIKAMNFKLHAMRQQKRQKRRVREGENIIMKQKTVQKAQEKKQNKKKKKLAIKVEVKDKSNVETSFNDHPAVKIEKDRDKNKELAIKIEVKD